MFIVIKSSNPSWRVFTVRPKICMFLVPFLHRFFYQKQMLTIGKLNGNDVKCHLCPFLKSLALSNGSYWEVIAVDIMLIFVVIYSNKIMKFRFRAGGI